MFEGDPMAGIEHLEVDGKRVPMEKGIRRRGQQFPPPPKKNCVCVASRLIEPPFFLFLRFSLCAVQEERRRGKVRVRWRAKREDKCPAPRRTQIFVTRISRLLL